MKRYARTEDDEDAKRPRLRGRFAGAGHSDGGPRRPERQLLAAIILRALADALAGDAEAADWMDTYAPGIACLWLDVDRDAVADWRRLFGVMPGHFWDHGPRTREDGGER